MGDGPHTPERLTGGDADKSTASVQVGLMEMCLWPEIAGYEIDEIDEGIP
jgi:hypothetical protein